MRVGVGKWREEEDLAGLGFERNTEDSGYIVDAAASCAFGICKSETNDNENEEGLAYKVQMMGASRCSLLLKY